MAYSPQEMVDEALEWAESFDWDTDFLESLQGRLADGRELTENQQKALERTHTKLYNMILERDSGRTENQDFFGAGRVYRDMRRDY